MQNEHRCVRRGGVDFVEGRHAAFGELKFAPAADDANPLAGRRAFRLLLQHAQAVGERTALRPSGVHVVIETAANDVQVRIVESRDDAAAVEVDEDRVRAALEFVAVDADNAAVFNRNSRRLRMFRIESGDLSVVENQVREVFRAHGFLSSACSQRAARGSRGA